MLLLLLIRLVIRQRILWLLLVLLLLLLRLLSIVLQLIRFLLLFLLLLLLLLLLLFILGASSMVSPFFACLLHGLHERLEVVELELAGVHVLEVLDHLGRLAPTRAQQVVQIVVRHRHDVVRVAEQATGGRRQVRQQLHARTGQSLPSGRSCSGFLVAFRRRLLLCAFLCLLPRDARAAAILVLFLWWSRSVEG